MIILRSVMKNCTLWSSINSSCTKNTLSKLRNDILLFICLIIMYSLNTVSNSILHLSQLLVPPSFSSHSKTRGCMPTKIYIYNEGDLISNCGLRSQFLTVKCDCKNLVKQQLYQSIKKHVNTVTVALMCWAAVHKAPYSNFPEHAAQMTPVPTKVKE